MCVVPHPVITYVLGARKINFSFKNITLYARVSTITLVWFFALAIIDEAFYWDRKRFQMFTVIVFLLVGFCFCFFIVTTECGRFAEQAPTTVNNRSTGVWYLGQVNYTNGTQINSCDENEKIYTQ